MEKDFLEYISTLLETNVVVATPLSGGDINEAYLLKTDSESLFIKWNDEDFALQMFEAEAAALRAIANTGSIATPEIKHVGSLRNKDFLILEFIEEKASQTKDDQARFGRDLAALHANSDEQFGWSQNNFIGTLSQINNKCQDWDEFYITQRLEIQYSMARSNDHLPNTNINTINRFYKEIGELLKGIKPSLLHGDLWSGNYIIDRSGKTYLIDPASYYGHSEIDLAMSELFGGFSNEFYEAYSEVSSISEGYSHRLDIYQLYYLLVHLNLFGKSYEAKCEKILRKFI